MKRKKTFNTIEQLWEYILKSNLKATDREWDKITLSNNMTGEFKEFVYVTF